MIAKDRFVQIPIRSRSELRGWLESHYGQEESVWLVTWKKRAGEGYVSTQEILDELVCFGWVDGVLQKLDENRTLRLASPRRTQRWAKSYKDRASRLGAEGRMHESGLRCIEEAKRLGLWTAMDDVDAFVVPIDLTSALASFPAALERFEAFAPSYRRNVLRWLAGAKTPGTRVKRIDTIADHTHRGVKIPHL